MNSSTTDKAISSSDSSAADELTEGQRERLALVLDRYLSALEQGRPLHVETLLATHEDLAEPLRTSLRSLNELHDLAAGFQWGAKSGRHTSRWSESGGATAEEAGAEGSDPASRIGDYRLVREIGRGGMGVVYEACQISLGRRVALKVLPFAAVLDARQIARFKNEAQAAAQLHHPHIVPVYAIGVERGVHYYAMQLIEGQSLDLAIEELKSDRNSKPSRQAHLDGATASGVLAGVVVDTVIDDLTRPSRSSTLSRCLERPAEYFRTVTQLGIEAAEALHAAHEEGVVHRDIKPSNLLLDAEGKLWVTDFGLARFRADAPLTRTGDVVGTMHYMSPEQAAGQSALVDHRTDIYSLGATLYELISLQPARGQAASVGTSTCRWEPASRPMHGSDEPIPLRKLRPEVPAELETVVHKALARSRDDRYATARDLAEDLQRILNGEPTIARPPTLLDRWSGWSQRNGRLVAWATATCVLALTVLSAGMFLIAREKLRAEQSLARAESFFKDAQNTVDRFGMQLAERLAEVPGAADVRRELLQDTLRYYQGFVARAQTDTSLQSELAMVYSKMATLSEQLGNLRESLVAHQQAVQRFEQLVRSDFHDAVSQRRLGQCLNNYGLTLQRLGRVDDAQRVFRQAIRAQEPLSARFPQSHDLAADLARTHSNLGLLYCETDRRTLAEISFRDAIRWQERLVDQDPDRADAHRDLAASCNNLASLLEGLDAREAIRYYECALLHESAAAAARPDLLRYRADLALTHNNLGALLGRQGDDRSAVDRYAKAIAIQKELVKLAPMDGSYHHDLAVTFNNAGMAWCRLGNFAEAERLIRQSIACQLPLARQKEHEAALRSSLGGAYHNLGMVLEKRQQGQQAEEAFRQAIEHQQAAHELAPDVMRYRTLLDQHHRNHDRLVPSLNPQPQARTARERPSPQRDVKRDPRAEQANLT